MNNNTFQIESMNEETEQMLQMRYLTPKNCHFKRTPGGFLSLTHNDTTYERIWVIRMFPFTNPEDYISIRSTEEHSVEIGIIEHMNSFDADTQTMLSEQMNLRYFTPIITQIKQIKTEYGYAYFDVVTDRGECRFTINMGSNAVSHLSENRLLISDLDNNRFEIPDIMKLSPKERKKLDLFI